MTPRHRHLIAILLVLVMASLFACTKEEASRTTGGEPTCAHACCHAHAAASRLAQPDEVPVEGLDAFEASQPAHDHDCDVCSRLHRLHGFVAAPTDFDTAPTRLVDALRVAPQRRVDSAFVANHRARAPPRNAA